MVPVKFCDCFIQKCFTSINSSLIPVNCDCFHWYKATSTKIARSPRISDVDPYHPTPITPENAHAPPNTPVTPSPHP